MRPRTTAQIVGREKVIIQVRNWIAGVGTRKQKPICLLSASPGSGKTSIAEAALREGGYDPVALNASDDRSESKVSTWLRLACHTPGPGKKPPAVIIEEIDGSIEGTITAITNFLKKSVLPLALPIIATCNEAHARQLKPIMQHCLKVMFYPLFERPAYDLLDRALAKLKILFATDSQKREIVRRAGGDARQVILGAELYALGAKTEAAALTYKDSGKDISVDPYLAVKALQRKAINLSDWAEVSSSSSYLFPLLFENCASNCASMADASFMADHISETDCYGWQGLERVPEDMQAVLLHCASKCVQMHAGNQVNKASDSFFVQKRKSTLRSHMDAFDLNISEYIVNQSTV